MHMHMPQLTTVLRSVGLVLGGPLDACRRFLDGDIYLSIWGLGRRGEREERKGRLMHSEGGRA
jgi:hypothetical protein